MTRKRPRRATWQDPSEAPVVLAHAVIRVTETGSLDGTPFPPPHSGAWTRSSFGALLDTITHDRTTAARIEVHETDGSTFTDIIHARRRTTADRPIDTPKDNGKHPERHREPDLIEVTAEGFVPGEDIAVAVIVAHTDATGTGSARALLDKHQLPALLDDGVGEVVLFGRVSGTVEVRRLP